MLIEHNYVIPGGTYFNPIMELAEWCKNNLSENGFYIRYENAQQPTVYGLQGSLQHIVKSTSIHMTLRFTNHQDINYFKLIFGDTFDKFIHSTTFQS